MKIFISSLIIALLTHYSLLAQAKDSTKHVHFVPEIKTYIGIAHPLYTFSADSVKQNFRDYYGFAVPVGINILKSPKVGFSFEVVSFVRTENKDTKISYILFHPGVLYRLGKGYTFAGRLAFETSGRLGFTPIISKVLLKKKDYQLFGSFVLPFRFGNEHAATLSTVLLIGISF